MAQIRFVKINNGTDGDAAQVPNASTHRKVEPPTPYLDKVGTSWMQYRGEAQAGVTYRLNRLPDGYTVWERPRSSDPSHVDKWCFGHPSGKYFDSPNKFLPHFLNLMEEGNARDCECVNCKKRGPGRPKARATTDTTKPQVVPSTLYNLPSRPPGRPSGRPPRRPRGRPPGRPVQALPPGKDEILPDLNAGLHKAKGRNWVEGRTDEEGTPDPYRNNIDRLKVLGSLNTLIEESMSADWRAERASDVEGYFKHLKQKPTWKPRRMEIVLFVRALLPKEKLLFNPETKRFIIIGERGSELKEPLWEAGIVTQTSQEARDATEYSVTGSGYRVEPLSSANTKEGKGIWKQYTYVRVDQIRPFNLWKNFLAGVDPSEWHETISNAMLVMSTITVVKRYRFKGQWPEAKVYCRGMYLGAELIVEGDFVYLLPESAFDDGITDVMRIDAITLELWNLDKASNDDYDDGHPYNCAARITGRAYTNDKGRSFDNEPVELDTLAPGTSLDRLGPWYPRTPADKLSRIPFHRIMSRSRDPDVVEEWIHGQKLSKDGAPLTKAGVGMSGVIEARKWCSTEFRRIDEGKSWFWADTRVEALDLEEVNGLIVSSQDPDRDPKKYRREIRVIEGTARPEERLALQQAERRTSMRGANGMLASALNLDGPDSGENSGDRKRSRSALGRSEESEEGDEDDDEVERNEFVDQMAEGLAMSDEAVSSGDGDDAGRTGRDIRSIVTPRGSIPMVIIDRGDYPGT